MKPTLTPHPLQPVTLKDVVIDDVFWSPWLHTLREVTLPDVLDKFEQTGALANFDRVRDHQTGGHAGPLVRWTGLRDNARGCRYAGCLP
jgi:hypothetical protein